MHKEKGFRLTVQPCVLRAMKARSGGVETAGLLKTQRSSGKIARAVILKILCDASLSVVQKKSSIRRNFTLRNGVGWSKGEVSRGRPRLTSPHYYTLMKGVLHPGAG